MDRKFTKKADFIHFAVFLLEIKTAFALLTKWWWYLQETWWWWTRWSMISLTMILTNCFFSEKDTVTVYLFRVFLWNKVIPYFSAINYKVYYKMVGVVVAKQDDLLQNARLQRRCIKLIVVLFSSLRLLMSLHMQSKMIWPREAPIAVRTLERLRSSMFPEVTS